MGIVYRARHLESGSEVALKTVLVPHVSFLQGLRRELRALSRIRHPGIARVLGEGVEEGVPWYAMEIVRGQSLRRYCGLPVDSGKHSDWWTLSVQQSSIGGALDGEVANTFPVADQAVDGFSTGGELPVSEGEATTDNPEILKVLTVVRRLCGPLAFLHGEGLVHLDLKPENILVTTGGRPVVVDFGLMSQFGGRLGRDSLALRSEGGGTVAYMSPEQILGSPVDARADLYGLGCLLYELLTGKPPFRGRTKKELLEAHLQKMPAPPSRYVEGISKKLDDLVLRLLAKHPRARPGYAGDVASDLLLLGADSAVAEPSPQPRAFLYRPGFTGREKLFGRLRNRAGALAATPKGEVLLIGGERGVGKTRLALELASATARTGLLILTGEARPLAGGIPGEAPTMAPLQALRRPLQSIADRCRELGFQETNLLLGNRGKILALYEPALEKLPGQELYPEPVDLPPRAARLRLLSYLAETFLNLAMADPVLLILDDFQWADDLALGFLRLLLDSGRLERSRLLVVCLYRTENALPELEALESSRRCSKLLLEPLDENGIGRIVADMLGLSAPPELFVRLLAQQAEGNPFFVAEYLHAMVADGLLSRDEVGCWQVSVSGEDSSYEAIYEALPLPRSLQELMRRRLDGVGTKARKTITCCSVLGAEIDAELLERLLKPEKISALDALEELLNRQILVEPKAGRLRFVHDHFRSMAYGAIPLEERQSLHRRAAELLEAGGLGLESERLASMGHHWELAEDRDRALDAYLRAAVVARHRHLNSEAIRLYRAYFHLRPGPSSQSVKARNELAKLLLQSQGKIEEAIELHKTALQEARDLCDGSLEIEGLFRLGAARDAAGESAEGQSCLEQALNLSRRAGDLGQEGQILMALGTLEHRRGHFIEAREHYERSLEIHQTTGNLRSQAFNLANLASLQKQQGRRNKARKLFDEALKLTRQVGDPINEGNILGSLAVLHSTESRLDLARPLYEKALKIHRSVGYLRGEAVQHANLGEDLFLTGDFSGAVSRWELALSLAREASDYRSAALVTGNLARLHHHQGKLDKAQLLFHEALELSRKIGDRYTEAITRCNLSALLLDQGDPLMARRLLEQALAVHRETGDRRFEARTLLQMSRLERLAANNASRGDEMTRRAARLFDSLDDRYSQALCLCEQGHALLAQGRDGNPCLARAKELASPLDLLTESPLCQAINGLERAQAAFVTGGPKQLIRGQIKDDIPRRLRLLLDPDPSGPGTPGSSWAGPKI